MSCAFCPNTLFRIDWQLRVINQKVAMHKNIFKYTTYNTDYNLPLYNH